MMMQITSECELKFTFVCLCIFMSEISKFRQAQICHIKGINAFHSTIREMLLLQK